MCVCATSYQLYNFGHSNANLSTRVAVADGDHVVLGGALVHRNGKRDANLIGAGVALANGCIAIVDLQWRRVSW